MKLKQRIVLIASLCTSAGVSTLHAEATQRLMMNSSGNPGIVNSPSAFVAPDGQTWFTYYQNDNISGQRLGFQASYGLQLSTNFSDSETDGVDQLLDIKYQILPEGDYLPALAVGANDAFGLGEQSAEYVVASKSLGIGSAGVLEAHLGMGWGALGDGGDRPQMDTQKFSTDHYFKGESAAFGGVVWHSPFAGISLGAEYSGANSTALGDDHDPMSYSLQFAGERWAVGLYGRNQDDFGFAVTLSGNPNRPIAPPNKALAPIAIMPRSMTGADLSSDWARIPGIGKAMGGGLAQMVEAEGYRLNASRLTGNHAELEIKAQAGWQGPKALGRIARSLAMNAPGSVELFTLSFVNSESIAVTSVQLTRTQLEQMVSRDDRTQKSWDAFVIKGAKPLSGDDVYRPEKAKKFSIGGGVKSNRDWFEQSDDNDEEDESFITGFTPFATATYDSGRGFSVNARASFHLGDLDQEVILESTDAEYRTRSDSKLYTQNRVTLDRLTADYFFKVGADVYGRATAGLIERQYAGVDGELIYSPASSRLAYGLQLAQVQKRDPDSLIGLLDQDSISTGHATVYWDTGLKGVDMSLGYGRFLAGDWGTTAKISRKFVNGWEVEGGLVITENFADSRDGADLIPSLSIRIPLQWIMEEPFRSSLSLNVAKSSGDYGARLRVANPLHKTIRDYEKQDFEFRWGAFWQ